MTTPNTPPRPRRTSQAIRRIGRWAFKRLPQTTRHAIMRRRAQFDVKVLDGVTIEMANTVEAYLAAFRLVHDAYVERGWIRPQPSGLWPTRNHLFPEATVFLMRKHGEPIGTATFVEDSAIGLPIDETFPEEMKALRASGERHIGEFSSLAVAPSARRNGLPLVLMVSMFRYAKLALGVTDMVITVSAHIPDYYGALFNMSCFTEVRSYGGFRADARAADYDPVVGLHQQTAASVAYAVEQMQVPPAGFFNMLTLYFSAFPAPYEQLPAPGTPKEELVRYKLPREVFRDLFMGRTDELRQLAPHQRQHLEGWRTFRTLATNPGVSTKAPPPPAFEKTLKYWALDDDEQRPEA